MRISHAVADARDIKVPFPDDVLSVTYRPTSATPADLARIQAEADEAEEARQAAGKGKSAIDLRQIDTMVESMTELLIAWDLTEDPDEDWDGVSDLPLIPITVEALRDVPIPVFVAIMKAVRKDQDVDPEAHATSDAG